MHHSGMTASSEAEPGEAGCEPDTVAHDGRARTGIRVRRPPVHLRDFVCVVSNEYCNCVYCLSLIHI